MHFFARTCSLLDSPKKMMEWEADVQQIIVNYVFYHSWLSTGDLLNPGLPVHQPVGGRALQASEGWM